MNNLNNLDLNFYPIFCNTLFCGYFPQHVVSVSNIFFVGLNLTFCSSHAQIGLEVRYKVYGCRVC